MSKEISQELAERMAACLRRYATGENNAPETPSVFAEALAIVKLLPELVDPNLVEARRMAADLNQGSTRAEWVSGRWDNGPAVKWHLAGIRRGLELAKARAGEGSV